VKRASALAHRDRPLGQGHALVAAQGPGQPIDLPARHARRGPAREPPSLPRLPLREELRLLYHLDDPSLAPEHLDAWLAWATRSRLRPFARLVRTLREHRDGILAAIRLGLSNGRLEA
jgi:Transposase